LAAYLTCCRFLLSLQSPFFSRSGLPRDLPSFPTRRSSDLGISMPTRSVPFGAVSPVSAGASSAEVASPEGCADSGAAGAAHAARSEEHTSELQSRENLVCRLLLEKKKSSRPAWPSNPGLTA